MALLQGGFDTGFQMHDIIRQYCISRCPGLKYSVRLPNRSPMLPYLPTLAPGELMSPTASVPGNAICSEFLLDVP